MVSFNKIALGAVLTSIVSAGSSGLQIEVLTKVPASECVAAGKGDTIRVHYTGQLDDGTVFDSSYPRGEPITFTLGVRQVIPGWDQGLDGICVGEKRKLTIPSDLAYGDSGIGGVIPPKATLTFESELVEIVEKANTKDEL
ncbi:peptidyl-prolyl cis-trans isomerase Fpr2p [[Candida] anglica]|uniref:peptidylprolyl isomerase n=1 Tax=[Candida] anglica TaxID=148631 RepID=A0ABP0ED85_9ASCO